MSACFPIINSLNISNATISIDGLGITNLSLTSFELPGISAYESPQQHSPYPSIKHNTDKYEFAPLICTFLLANNFENWLKLFSWFNMVNQIYDKLEYTHDPYSTKSGVITLLTNTGQAVVFINFDSLVPTFLSNIPFKFNVTDSEIIECQFIAEFTNYTIKSANQ